MSNFANNGEQCQQFLCSVLGNEGKLERTDEKFVVRKPVSLFENKISSDSVSL